MLKPKKIDKKLNRLIAGKCQICGEKRQSTLHNHRMIEGKDLGEYTPDNVISCCSNCHSDIAGTSRSSSTLDRRGEY